MDSRAKCQWGCEAALIGTETDTSPWRNSVSAQFGNPHALWPSNSIQVGAPRTVYKGVTRDIYKNVKSSTIRNSKELGRIQISINSRTDEQCTLCSFSGMLYSNKNQWIILTCNNTDKSHYLMLNKRAYITPFTQSLEKKKKAKLIPGIVHKDDCSLWVGVVSGRGIRGTAEGLMTFDFLMEVAIIQLCFYLTK